MSHSDTTKYRVHTGIRAVHACIQPGVEANPRLPKLNRLYVFTRLEPDQMSLNHHRYVVSTINKPLFKYLVKWEIQTPQHPPFAIRPVMLGRSEDDARLWMVVFCEERFFKRAKRYFKRPETRQILVHPEERPEYDVKVYVANGSVMPLAHVVAQLPAKAIRGLAHEDALCGAPLWFFNPETSAARHVTLGGVVEVTINGRGEYFGMTVGHAVEELEDATPRDKAMVDSEADCDSKSISDISSAEDSESEATTSLGGEDLPLHPHIARPRSQERDSPWESNSFMLTIRKATADPRTNKFYDWALVSLGNLPNDMGIFSRTAHLVDGHMLLPQVPSDGDFDKEEGSAVVIMSAEGPKRGTVSFFPSKLLLHPGRTFVDTYIVHLDEPYVYSHGDSGAWVMNSRSGLVYGHLVATDILGGGHVIPMLDTLEDIKNQLGATDVVFPGTHRNRVDTDSESADITRSVSYSRRGLLPHVFRSRSPSDDPSDEHSIEFSEVFSDNTQRKVFEVLTTTDNAPEGPIGWHKAKAPRVTIWSPSLVYALRFIIRYYPGVDLAKESPTFRWPFSALVHHYGELQEYAADCELKGGHKLCPTKEDIPRHVRLLLEYLDRTVMDRVNEELERNRRGMYTFDFAWVSQKPGTTIIYHGDNPWLPRRPVLPTDPNRDLMWLASRGPFVVLPIESSTPDAPWSVEGWKLEHDGSKLGRVIYSFTIPPFVGEKQMPWHILKPVPWQWFHKSLEANEGVPVKSLQGLEDFPIEEDVSSDDSVWDSTHEFHYKRYKGVSAKYPQIKIDSVVVIDHQEALRQHPTEGIPPLMSDIDLATWHPHCPCDACIKSQEEPDQQQKEEPGFWDYVQIDPRSGQTLTQHQHLLCPTSTWAFVLKTRTWQKLLVRHLRSLPYEKAPMDRLVMDEERKQSITRLVDAYHRGLVLHLYGDPGLGKSFTAECIAAHTRRPLVTLTSSVVLDSSVKHGQELMGLFRLANRWRLIVHFRDCDKLLAESSSAPGASSSSTNAFRGAFRDALDTNQGLVILETSRVDDLGEDVISKTHAQVHYPPFSDAQRRKVWNTICDNYATLNIYFGDAARDIISTPKVKALKWNGHDIRRVTEGAVALTPPDDSDSDETHVTRNDLDVMVELSGKDRCPSTGTGYRPPLGLATSIIVVIIVVAAAAVGFLQSYQHTTSFGPNYTVWKTVPPEVLFDVSSTRIGARRTSAAQHDTTPNPHPRTPNPNKAEPFPMPT